MAGPCDCTAFRGRCPHFWALSCKSWGCFSLLQNKEFLPSGLFKSFFAWSFVLLVVAALFSCAAVITRLLDFRLTARKVRKEQKSNYSRSLTIFRIGPDAYGRATWGLFWLSCVSFVLGVVFLFVSVGATYAARLQ